MSNPSRATAASYAYCGRIARRAGSSFYPCFLLLGRSKRRAMNSLYAFMRHTDDLADNPDPIAVRRQALDRWRASLEAALSGRSKAENAGAKEHSAGVSRAPHEDRLLLALADTVDRFQIPPEHLHAVIDGVEMDLDRQSYETFDGLSAYCERVASAVGLACIHVWGFRGRPALEPARKCGIAMQITNILRDLKEDAASGRVYLPLEDLRRFDYSVGDLTAGVTDERFFHLVRFEIDRARRYYHEGAELIDWLEPDGRRIFGMMMTVYSRLLDEIQRRPGDVFRRRIRLGRWRKLAIAARWTLLPPRRSALP